jgi:hypothetical protein
MKYVDALPDERFHGWPSKLLDSSALALEIAVHNRTTKLSIARE